MVSRVASCGDVNATQGNSDFGYLEETEETWIHARQNYS
jgi:hypothetical protein